MPRRTPFHEYHRDAGARLIDFGGWEMPVQYQGLQAEHAACRTAVGCFDVSHMGEVRFRGPHALAAVNHLVTNDISKCAFDQAMYTAMCNERGGIVDDLIVYRIAEEDILICVNAANRQKDYAWMKANNPFCAEIVDESDQWGQLAIQGPRAIALGEALLGRSLADVKNYWFTRGPFAGIEGCIVARTGYTGEDGFEVFLPAGAADVVWTAIHEAGAAFGLTDIGLGARDTLRLEMKYCLYGNDIDDDTTPLEAGLAWVTKLDKGEFVGRDRLVAQREAGVPRRLVGLQVQDRIARQHNAVLHGGQIVGQVTSGTRSPCLGTNIAIAYVPAALSKPGTAVEVDVRGKIALAEVVKTPFYTRPT
ncbi:MAG: glycine cleavage system aminomethyltransferase GcvT [Myxococcales bacterium]|nr:glycine cleavage system aminomethyltransferase GcvT [Myxococcales bacterium]